MAYRVSKGMVEHRIKTLNRLLGQSENPWKINDKGTYESVEGVFILDHMGDSGYRLCRIVGNTGGEQDISPRLSARELLDFINGVIIGIELAQGKR